MYSCLIRCFPCACARTGSPRKQSPNAAVEDMAAFLGGARRDSQASLDPILEDEDEEDDDTLEEESFRNSDNNGSQ